MLPIRCAICLVLLLALPAGGAAADPGRPDPSFGTNGLASLAGFLRTVVVRLTGD